MDDQAAIAVIVEKEIGAAPDDRVPQARPAGQPDGRPQIAESVRLKVQIRGSPDPEKGMAAQGLVPEERFPNRTLKNGGKVVDRIHFFHFTTGSSKNIT